MTRSTIAHLLEQYGYKQDTEPSEYNVRYWRSPGYTLTVSIVDGVWEACDDKKVERGTWTGLRRLTLAILRTKK